jgi:hypothetical protein
MTDLEKWYQAICTVEFVHFDPPMEDEIRKEIIVLEVHTRTLEAEKDDTKAKLIAQDLINEICCLYARIDHDGHWAQQLIDLGRRVENRMENGFRGHV